MFLVWTNVISGLIIAIIFATIIFFDRKNSKLELANIKLIVLAGILVAISVVLNTAVKVVLNTVISASIFEAKTGNFALVLIGFFCGGALGVLAGIAADFLGLLLFTAGTPVLFFTLMSVLWCVLPYYLVRILNKFYQKKWTIYCYLPLSYALNLLLVSALNPVILVYLYHVNKGWWILYLPRIIKFPIDVSISSVLLVTSYRIFASSLVLNQKFYQDNKTQKLKTGGSELDHLVN